MKDKKLENEIERYFKNVVKKNPMPGDCAIKPGARAEILKKMAVTLIGLLDDDQVCLFDDYTQAMRSYDSEGIMGKMKFPIGLKGDITANGPGYDIHLGIFHKVKHSLDATVNVGGRENDTPDLFSEDDEGATGAPGSTPPPKPKR